MKIPQCERCHHSWWPTKFNWITGQPEESTWCPCCISANWKQPFKSGRGPDEEEGVAAYCPRCDKEFISRQIWLDKQASIRQNESNPYLPVPIADKEKAKAELAALRAQLLNV